MSIFQRGIYIILKYFVTIDRHGISTKLLTMNENNDVNVILFDESSYSEQDNTIIDINNSKGSFGSDESKD